MPHRLPRRQFVKTVASAAAVSALPPGTRRMLAEGMARASLSSTPPWNEQGILNLARSPHAKLKNVPVRAVALREGFWSARRTANVEKSIPSMGRLLEANGRLDNFRRLTGQSTAPQRGPV